MEQASLYSTKFANPMRNSWINTKTAAIGKVTWSAPTGFTASKYWPAIVQLWKQYQVVSTYGDLTLFDSNGKIVWTKKKQGGSPVTVAGEWMYFKNPSKFLDAVDLAGDLKLKSASFPSAMGDEKVEFFYPRKDDFFAVMFDNDQRDHQQGDENPPPIQPKLNLVKNRYPISYGDWLEAILCRDHLPPIFVPEKNFLSLLTDKKLIRIDLDKEKRLSETAIDFDGAIEWSMNLDETYFILTHQKSRPVMLAIRVDSSDPKKAKNVEMWRWKSELEQDDSWLAHPPVVGAKGTIYALTTTKLHALENGKLLWQFEVPTAKDEMSFITALADESLLLANGKVLHRIDKSGKHLWKLALPSEILSSPVVDEKGNIFVSTATDLIRVN